MTWRLCLRMQRDILFFVEQMPAAYHLAGKNLFMGPVGQQFVELFGDLSKTIPQLNPFSSNTAKDKVTIAGFRNDFANEREAVRDAWDRLEGILDATCLLTEEHQPKIGPVVMIREGDQTQAAAKNYVSTGWARWEPASEEIKKQWQERNSRVADYVMGFINSVAFVEATTTTELGRQLAYSMKMFRRGIAAGCPGIEYVCKFSALEGLVCGSKTTDKSATLKTNLGTLFCNVNPGMKQELQRLWKQRCRASHQAMAFDAKLIADLPLLDSLVLATFVFALDHLQTATTTNELWGQAQRYVLPNFVHAGRPRGIFRFAVQDCLIDFSVRIKGVGPIADRAFEEALRKVESSSK